MSADDQSFRLERREPLAAKLAQELLDLFVVELAEPAVDAVFDRRQPAPAHRLRDDGMRPAAFASHFREDSLEVAELVAVDRIDIEAECSELVGERLERHELLGRDVRLDSVSV